MWRFRPPLPAQLPDLDRATEPAAGAAHQHPVADVGDIAPRAGANHGAGTLTTWAQRRGHAIRNLIHEVLLLPGGKGIHGHSTNRAVEVSYKAGFIAAEVGPEGFVNLPGKRRIS